MKKNVLPVLIIAGLIAIILVYLGVSYMIDKYTPTDERKDLTEYYNITEENQVAITLDNKVLEAYGTLIDGQVYLDYEFVYDYLNSRFYWDTNENILLYTTSTDVVSAKAEATSYNVGKSTTDFGKVVVKPTAESALIHLDFVSKYTDISVATYEAPKRIVITSDWGDITVANAKNDTHVRVKGGIKSPILSDVAKGTSLTVLEEEENWTKVCTADGITGYVEKKALSAASTKTLVSDFPKETFKHIKHEKPINLLWYQSSNSKISTTLSKVKGVNVVSPTWFKIADNEGNISSTASHDFVKYCHDHNIEVWGLISNFEVKEVSSIYVLTHTSTRQNLVNQIVAKAVEYNLDGVNIDFEFASSEKESTKDLGDGYIQFLRELSIKLHALDISLSTDIPEVTSANHIYAYGDQPDFVDYVILMAYDQHTGQKTGSGSVAALDWSTNAVKNVLKEGVPSDQLVLGIPFYTKLWIHTPKIEENASEVTYIISFQNIGMDTAKTWLDKNVSEPVWLEDCGQFYGESTKNDVIYKIWMEDTASLEKRLQMMQEQKLAGAAFWKSGFDNEKAWDVIIKYIN